MAHEPRLIGIRYRVEASIYGPMQPTQVYIWSAPLTGSTLLIESEDEEKHFLDTVLRSGDTALLATGPSSDRLAYEIAYRGLKLGIKVYRIKFAELQAHVRGGLDDSSRVLTTVFRFRRKLFSEVSPNDVTKWRIRHQLDQKIFGF